MDNMDLNQNYEQPQEQPQGTFPQPQRRNSGFTVASCACGMLSMALCITGVLGLPLGALSILFAVLSKRRGERLSTLSLVGIILSVIGIVLGLAITAYAFYLVFHDPFIREQVDMVFESIYGMDFEAFFDSIL